MQTNHIMDEDFAIAENIECQLNLAIEFPFGGMGGRAAYPHADLFIRYMRAIK